MVYAALRIHRRFNLGSPLLIVFYRDGIVYFICLCLSVLASINLAANLSNPGGYRFFFTQLEISLHGILSTRMLLHLREVAARGPDALWNQRLAANWTGSWTGGDHPRTLSPLQFGSVNTEGGSTSTLVHGPHETSTREPDPHT
ncbi:hypothetical protein DFP72DRAFT_521096 [Ephemerocybe angulata]|uniref:Uncharacterized protein n=1 Tax=Ephemerocybe angulata TaxID=980116 RepID=A0A8H6ICH9_9AGAR|nr:hypothetical protein DFP72DRAFT_521096 [Tulosesus angulatus]